MTEQPTQCGALLPWPYGPPSVCARRQGHSIWHESADGVVWAGPERVSAQVCGGMQWRPGGEVA